MAREAHDREDLLREATALVERVELSIPSQPESIVAGYRRDGSLSLYFGGDPVYQFNTSGELRRAFVGDVLYKAGERRLAALRRQRTDHESVMLRHELTEVEQSALLVDAARRIHDLAKRLDAGNFRLVGQVPPEGRVIDRLRQCLATLADPLPVAARPHAK